MLAISNRNYVPVSREDHHRKMQAFIKSLEGLPPGKYEYKHILSDGVYIRQLKLTKGTTIVGAVHKRETAMIILSGSIKVFSEDGLVIMKPGSIKVSPPGTQRAGYALEDTVLITLHRSDSLNLEEIVTEFGEGEVDKLSGITEGQYKLYINGRKIKDEKIQPTSENIIGNGHLQRLLFN
jgi:quercetin dioxygenase-like cupin family protein